MCTVVSRAVSVLGDISSKSSDNLPPLTQVPSLPDAHVRDTLSYACHADADLSTWTRLSPSQWKRKPVVIQRPRVSLPRSGDSSQSRGIEVPAGCNRGDLVLIDDQLYHVWATDDSTALHSDRFAYCMKLSDTVNARDPQTGVTARYSPVACLRSVGTVVKSLALSKCMADDAHSLATCPGEPSESDGDFDLSAGPRQETLDRMTDQERKTQTIHAKLVELGPAARLHCQLELILMKALTQANPGENLWAVWHRAIAPDISKAFEEHQKATKELNNNLMNLGKWNP